MRALSENTVVVFLSMDQIKRYVGLKLLKEHGDLYFSLLHNSGIKFIPFQLGDFKKRSSKGNKDKARQSPLLQDANYDLERNNSRNILSRCHLNFRDFPANYILKLSHTLKTLFLSSFTLKTLVSSWSKMYRELMK